MKTATNEAMRYIRVPKAVTIVKQRMDDSGEVVTFGEKPYTYFDMLDEMVWPRLQWRKDEVHMNAWNRLVDAHEEAKEKGLPVIACTQEDFAIFKPMATLSLPDQKLGGPNTKKITRLTQGVVFATSQMPEIASSPTNDVSEAPKPTAETNTALS